MVFIEEDPIAKHVAELTDVDLAKSVVPGRTGQLMVEKGAGGGGSGNNTSEESSETKFTHLDAALLRHKEKVDSWTDETGGETLQAAIDQPIGNAKSIDK